MSHFTDAHSQWLDSGVSVTIADAQRVPVRTDLDAQIGMVNTLIEILAELRRLNARLGSSSDSRSSIEVKTSTRGVDIASKAYADSSMEELSELAVDRYFATLEDVQRRLTAGNT